MPTRTRTGGEGGKSRELKLEPAMQPTIDIDDTIRAAIQAGAIVDFSLSGGKDSAATALATTAWLDSVNHPVDRRSATHAHLGEIEWPQTIDHIRALAEHLTIPLATIAQGNGLIDRWRRRFAAALRRYANLECYHLISPFSSASLRFCTGEMKTTPIRRSLGQRYPNQTVISVVGLRADESLRRAGTQISKIDQCSSARSQRPTIITWHPIRQWSIADVLEAHSESKIPLHYAYTHHNMTRLSCSFCVLASNQDLTNAARSNLNTAAHRAIAALEIESTFSFQPTRWLADLDPPSELQMAIAQAKRKALERRSLEASLPSDLKYIKGWPPRVPDYDEARAIADVRRTILAHHHLDTPYPTPSKIINRFAELHARKLPTIGTIGGEGGGRPCS